MPKYEFTEQQVSNLRIFLGRTDIKGSEVPAYVEIVNALVNPIQEELKEKEGEISRGE